MNTNEPNGHTNPVTSHADMYVNGDGNDRIQPSFTPASNGSSAHENHGNSHDDGDDDYNGVTNDAFRMRLPLRVQGQPRDVDDSHGDTAHGLDLQTQLAMTMNANLDVPMDIDINAMEDDMELMDSDPYTSIPPITRPVSIDLGETTSIDAKNELTLSLNPNEIEEEDEPSSLPPPPRPTEQSAREHLIERERQGRLEREKAKLKQKLVMKREREEEDQKFEEADFARVVNSEYYDSLAGSVDGNIDLDIDGVVDVGIEGDSVMGESSHCNGEGIVVKSEHGSLNGNAAVVLGQQNDERSGAGDDTNVGSVVCTVGEEDGTVNEDGAIENGNRNGGVTNDQSNGHDAEEMIGDEKSKSVSPLGFTMERFLNDGVVHVHGVSKKNDEGVSDVDSVVPLTNRHDDVNASVDINVDAAVHHAHVSSTPMAAPSSVQNGTEREDDGQGLGELSPVVSSRVVSIDVDVQHVGQRMDNDVDVDDIEEEEGAGHLQRLAQLTEAEILVMTDLDYASVGNMPPRSVRDERHLPDISGMSHASFDQTHTTVQGSDMSGGADSSQARSHGGDTAATVESPISNVARYPVETIVSPLPVDPFASAASNASIVVNQSDASVEQSDISDRKPAAINLPSARTRTHSNINNLDENEENWAHVENEEEKMRWPNDQEHVAKKSQSSLDLHMESLVNTAKDPNSSLESYNLPNRIIRPGMIKVASSSERSKSKGHRRAQTTPNIPSFVDDFDYCKYNDIGVNSNRGGQFFPSELDSQLQTNSHSHMNGDGNEEYFSNYGSVDMENQPLLTLKSEETRVSAVDEMVDSVFSSVRSMSTADFQAEINDCDKYSSSPALSRAVSDRFLPLFATIVVEIPVLLMISRGGDRLCTLIGRTRYQLLIGFLPLSGAISGNCGIQAGSLASRAISHLHVTKENYLKWLFTEIKVAAILGIGIGSFIGLIAFIASGHDFLFAFVIFIANFVCVLVSGFTGTLAPLVFTFIFHQDAGKWGSLIGTAFQDIVSAFAMVIFSFHILEMLGPGTVDDHDACGVTYLN